MLKKILALSLALVMMLTVFTGCSSEEPTPTESDAATEVKSEAPEKKEDVTITYLSTTILEHPEGDLEQAAIDEFNALDNGITVEVEGFSANDLAKKLITLATANNLPDMFMFNMNDTFTWADMGIPADCTELFGQEYIDGMDPAFLANSTIDGKVVGIPWFGSASAVLYRKDLFDEAGITEVPTTWEEMIEVGQKLTHDDQYGMALVGANNGSGVGRFVYVLNNFGVDEFTQDENGKWVTDIGSQNYIDALRAFCELDTKYGIVPPGCVECDYPTAVQQFSSGRAAMLITGCNAIGAVTSQVPELKGKLGSFSIPKVARSVNVPGGFAFMISESGEHKEACVEFVKFMLEKDRAMEFAELTGRLPTRTDVINEFTPEKNPEMAGFLDPNMEPYKVPTIPGYPGIYDIHGPAYQAVLTGQMTPEEAAAVAQERAQEICDTANEG